jgi:N-acetylmuramic acid 6-phosphate etherase
MSPSRSSRGRRRPVQASRRPRPEKKDRAAGAATTDFAALATEAPHPRSAQLHRRSTGAVVRLLLEEEQKSQAAALRAQGAITRAAELVATALAQGGRLIYAGAGTSGRLGALDAAELPPSFGLDPAKALAVVAGGPAALRRAVEGAEDRLGALRSAFRRLGVGPKDVVCAIAASGITPFARVALDEAAVRGAARIFITCAPHVARAVRSQVDVLVLLAVGPEVLAGSTRLKAGTATKMALNAISTAAMVRLGKVWRGRMVDLVATSAKLRDRAVRIVVELGGVERDEAAARLAAAGGHVKLALASALLGCEVAEARQRLERAGGDLEQALSLQGASVQRAVRPRKPTSPRPSRKRG